MSLRTSGYIGSRQITQIWWIKTYFFLVLRIFQDHAYFYFQIYMHFSFFSFVNVNEKWVITMWLHWNQTNIFMFWNQPRKNKTQLLKLMINLLDLTV